MGEDLENKTKEELIRHIRILNHNMDIMQKELDNSVSKDEIIKLIEEVDKQGDTSHVRQIAYYFADRTFVDKEGAIKILQKLLGGD